MADNLYECGSKMELIASESSTFSDFYGDRCSMTLVGIRANSMIWVFGFPGEDDDDLDFGGHGYVEDAKTLIQGIWLSYDPESQGYPREALASLEKLERLRNRVRLISGIANRTYELSRSTFSKRDQFANIMPSEILRFITKSKRATDGKNWVWMHPHLYLLENHYLRAGQFNGRTFWNEPLIKAFQAINIAAHPINITGLPESIDLFDRAQLSVQNASLCELRDRQRRVSQDAKDLEAQLEKLKREARELDSKILEQTQVIEAGIRQTMPQSLPPT